MANSVLDGGLFLEMVRGGACELRANVSIVNDLNVFPIPDGDTGDNMSMTIDGGIVTASSDTVLSEMSQKIAGGMLLSARGNSGVILSQLFAGIANGFDGIDTAKPKQVGEAFRAGVDKAYHAVGTPVEGTILTVARDATEYACSKLDFDSTVDSFFDDFDTEVRKSLDRTPDLLPVLKEAGVVDSGGAGLLYVIQGMKKVLSGEITEYEATSHSSTSGHVDVSLFDENSKLEFGYCTEFLLRLQNRKTDISKFNIKQITDYLEQVGNSIVAVMDGTIVKIHVHTMTPGDVLNYCQQFGEFLTLKIENMSLQHNEVESDIEDKKQAKEDSLAAGFRLGRERMNKKKFGVVAVASGDGIKELFESLGCDVIVDGGQTNNPSSEDFIDAFDACCADTVFVLPNNSNIRLAAEQAGEMYKAADVRVLNTKTIGDGYAALTMLDYSSDNADAIFEQLTEAFENVVTGQVTYAVRDADLNGVAIKKGDYIGFTGKEMRVSNRDKIETACTLADTMNPAEHDLIIIIAGKGATAEETQELQSKIESKYRSVEVYTIDGGQDVYDFIIIAD